MQCYTELLPPSGVTHALSIPFISATANNLVVAKTSLLQIYSLVNVNVGTDGGKPDDKTSRSDRSQDTRLVLVAEYPLHGTVTDISRVKILNSKSGGEAILAAFRNAKLSLIEWDPERHGISTISIHYYEREDLNRSPWVPDLSSCGSHLTVDPSSRCALLHFGARNLAILPFHQPGDDLVMDDYDPDLDGERSDHEMEDVADANKKDITIHQTPYASSFVLPLTTLDPSLLHPISLAFLYEYREPTFGILYSQVATSNALLHERKDVVFYSVFTLDLEQRASTTLLSVSRLPSDLFKVVALPPPVGGALLIGSNELVHVDQAGKTNAVGVNEFSRQISAFSMADQSDLALRLEGCVVEQLGTDNGDLVLALSNGDLVLVSFKLDGRSVSGISIYPLSAHASRSVLKAAASCSAALGHGKIFFGSEDTDSVLLGWSNVTSNTKKSRAQLNQSADDPTDLSATDDEEDEDDAYEDDLYSTAPSAPLKDHRPFTDSPTFGTYNFRLHDRLSNIGPLRDIALGRPPKKSAVNSHEAHGISAELELVASQGSDRSGGLVVLKREIDPEVVNSIKVDGVEDAWSVCVSEAQTKTSSNTNGQSGQKGVDRYVILSKSASTDKEESVVYTTAGNNFEIFKAPEFNPNEEPTIDVDTLANGSRVVQVLKSEVRSYDTSEYCNCASSESRMNVLTKTDLGLAQIYPVWDEDTSDERTVVSASFADPYLAILRDDSTLLVLQADESGDLDEVTVNEEITSRKWLSGCLYNDKSSFFVQEDVAEKSGGQNNLLLFLLSSECKLFVSDWPICLRY